MSDKRRWRVSFGSRPTWSNPAELRRSGSRVLGWVLAAFALYLMVMFGSLVVQAYRMQQQVAGEEQVIRQLESEQQALKDQLAYIKSDAAVEIRARDQLDMARPDEVVLQLQVVQPTATPPISDTTAPAAAPLPRIEDDQTPNWRRWWHMLFNS